MSQYSIPNTQYPITRLVKMKFKLKEVETFLSVFGANKERISSFEGCLHLELQRDVNSPNVFFTISRWRSEQDLENYRNSELFKSVWEKTKILFEEKAEAWTLNDVQID
jgi:quinol monooxygenase YgiN